MHTKTETIEGYTVNFKKHPFSKSIKVSVKDENRVLVTLPYFCPYKTARDFLVTNFEKIKSYKVEKPTLSADFKTKFDTLKVTPSDKFKIKKENRIINFYYPKDLDFNSNSVQKEFKKAYLEALKIEAKNYLPQRLEFLAKKYGFSYNKVALRNQKTRFGSCSFQNNINLNICLMKYDFEIIDYVLIHELTHTKVKNHSKRFWQEVEKHCPNYKELRKKLKST